MFFTWGFEWLIFKFNVNLEPHDQGDIGPTIGTATLAVYLVYAFHFLSENPEALNLKLLTNSGFYIQHNSIIILIRMHEA